ncbi:MAG: hypothetical protein CL609_22815 [Anaerolineaceae bacterium]|nr:hypothetical protein [Anaerolineaceae bacterium]
MGKSEANREAERRIVHVLYSGTHDLNLGGIDIKVLPGRELFYEHSLRMNIDAIEFLSKKLWRINLANNRIINLPEWFSLLTSLEYLNISDNLLKSIPEWLCQFQNLQSLVLNNNQISSVPNTIGNLKRLEHLKINNNKIELIPNSIGELEHLEDLDLSSNRLKELPYSIGKLKSLKSLDIHNNIFNTLPKSLGQLSQLNFLDSSFNYLIELPDTIGNLDKLNEMNIGFNKIKSLPEALGHLSQLKYLNISNNYLKDLPDKLSELTQLQYLFLDENPINLELAEAYKNGLDSVKAYLRAKAKEQIIINEAKLILVGEGEVGKTCLMDALLGNEWKVHPSTHGIEIRQVKIIITEDNSGIEKEITLNGWDFGGQRVYRPTHQLFFSAPAVYLVVWKPREGTQQGFVKEWIQLIKRREPSAKIIVVATHGGPQQRQPDIDRQELWDLFGRESIVDFFFVDSKPDGSGNRKGITELKFAIAHVAAALPEVGRFVPKSFQDVRTELLEKAVPFLPLDEVLNICRKYKMDDEISRLFIKISHSLGHLTHYENDPTLRDIIILRPDWLATAMSYVLDDEQTRLAHGLVKFSHLSYLWNNPTRSSDTRYQETLHPIFLRLMERFDLSYRVADPSEKNELNPLSLIGQLVPDIRPKNISDVWKEKPSDGDIQQIQVCRIVDAQSGQSANAEGLFYQLIVRLHKFSLGRVIYKDSIHWQRGLILDGDYNGRALLEHIGNDVRITVRAPFPVNFLAMLTYEVKYLIESFWEGLRCDVTVPCLNQIPCKGLFEVRKLIENKKRGRPEQPCPVCNEWQNIESLLLNSPSATQNDANILFTGFAEIKAELVGVRRQLSNQDEIVMGRFDQLDDRQRSILSRIDNSYNDLLRIFTDDAKEGPRLFSLVPVDRNNFNPRQWVRTQFRLTLWCEHSRLPLNSPNLNGIESKKGVYELELTREWFRLAGPYLKLLAGTLSLVLPIASSAIKLNFDEEGYKAIENELAFGKNVIDATIGETSNISDFWNPADTSRLEQGEAIRAQSSTLRELHFILKKKDPGFGGLVRVMNKRQEFLWVHERFAKEY